MSFQIKLESMNKLSVSVVDGSGQTRVFPLVIKLHQHEKYIEYLGELSSDHEAEGKERSDKIKEMERAITEFKREVEAGERSEMDDSPNLPRFPNAFDIMAGHLRKKPRRAVQFCHIILNPDQKQETISEEEIPNLFDLDQIEIICQTWVNKKVMNPQLDPSLDPLLAPRQPTKETQPER